MEQSNHEDDGGNSEQNDNVNRSPGDDGEVLDFSRPDYQFKPNEVHDWRQYGPYIECRSCELIHAQYIGMDELLVGLNEQGQPLFKKKSELT